MFKDSLDTPNNENGKLFLLYSLFCTILYCQSIIFTILLYSCFTSNIDLIKQALSEGLRLDGRKLLDYREIAIELSRYEATSTASIQISSTYVVCVLHGDIVTPSKDRPNEGVISFSANVSFQTERSAGSNSITDTLICRMLERSIKESDAIDMESLCILAGEKVWHLKCNINVLDCSGGNILDACCFAAMCSFRSFRKAEVSCVVNSLQEDAETGIAQNEVKVYSADEREPLPLALHHTPLTVSFAIMQDSNNLTLLLADPTLHEECAMDGRISYSVNAHKELCGIHKPGNGCLTRELIVQGAQLAYTRATVLHDLLSSALADLETTSTKEKMIRLERMKKANYERKLQLQATVFNFNNSNNSINNSIDPMANVINYDDPVLSWSSLHQSVASVSNADVNYKKK